MSKLDSRLDTSLIEKSFEDVCYIDIENLPQNTDPDYVFTYISLSDVEKGRILPTIQNIRFGQAPSRARRILHDRDILMATVRPNLQAFAILGTGIKDMIASTGFAVLTKKGNNSTEYIYHYLFSDHATKQINTLVAGSNYPAISSSAVKKLKIFIPSESHRQRKIARILTTIDKVIEQTENTIEKLKKIKQGMMHDLFTRGIDVKTGKLRPPYSEAPELYKQSKLGWIPREWKNSLFGDICLSLINGGTPSTSIREYWSGNIPWVTGADFLENFRIGLIRRYITRKAVKKSSTNIITKGEILLVTRTGVGKLAIAPFDISISQDITGVILNKKENDVVFVYYYLQLLVEEFKKLSQGTSINGIIREDLIKWPIIFPSNKKEQKEISKRLSAIDKKLAIEDSRLLKYQLIKQGLMQDLLNGKVEVAPDPQDFEEPEP